MNYFYQSYQVLWLISQRNSMILFWKNKSYCFLVMCIRIVIYYNHKTYIYKKKKNLLSYVI